MAVVESAFQVLGLADAHELELKADLVDRLGALIKQRKLTQSQAGALMGMGQADVSRMLRGHLDRFSVDRLLKALMGMGERVRVTFEPMVVAPGDAKAEVPQAAAKAPRRRAAA